MLKRVRSAGIFVADQQRTLEFFTEQHGDGSPYGLSLAGEDGS